MTLLRQEGGTRWPTEVPSNPYLPFCRAGRSILSVSSREIPILNSLSFESARQQVIHEDCCALWAGLKRKVLCLTKDRDQKTHVFHHQPVLGLGLLDVRHRAAKGPGHPACFSHGCNVAPKVLRRRMLKFCIRLRNSRLEFVFLFLKRSKFLSWFSFRCLTDSGDSRGNQRRELLSVHLSHSCGCLYLWEYFCSLKPHLT